jgi:hypothetical protein
MDKLPKSYLPEEEKQGLTRNEVYLAEADAANEAGDMESSWAWLRLADLPAYALKTLKDIMGADFVLEKGFPLGKANKAYGDNWLQGAR